MSGEGGMPGQYEPLHAFVFLSEKEGGVPLATAIANLQQYLNPQAGPVFFTSAFEGDFQGFAHIAQDDALALADFVDRELWDAGVRGAYAVEGRWHEYQDLLLKGPLPKGPVRKRYRFLALCRVHARQRPTRVMRNVADSFDDSDPPFVGASTVLADFHLLVELGDNDRTALDGHVALLREVEGIERVEVGIADTGPTQSA